MKKLVALISVFSFALAVSAQAYDEYSHEWITRSAFTYLKSTPTVYPETQRWISDKDAAALEEELLVRADVDTDYHPDVLVNAFLHSGTNGVESKGLIALLTSFLHFLTITSPGKYWKYDGYSYAQSTRHGTDGYLSLPTAQVDGEDSTAFGGGDSKAIPGAELGVFNLEFQGSPDQWEKMYFGWNNPTRAVFPPSYVLAKTAYVKMLATPRASEMSSTPWQQKMKVATGLFGSRDYYRNYWRGEVAGLPQYLDLLGTVMHLTQDATVPHHVEDTSDRCHPEYEAMVDRVTCRSEKPLDYSKYYDGDYRNGDTPQCDALYDPALVTQIIADEKLLDPSHPLSVEDRMIQAAQLTARWNWRLETESKYATQLPDGRVFEAKTCEEILSEDAVREQAKYQFNLAVAETVSIFEQAASDYEKAQPSSMASRAFSFLKNLF